MNRLHRYNEGQDSVNPELESLLGLLGNSLAMLGHGHFGLSQSRIEFLKKGMSPDVKKLCSSSTMALYLKEILCLGLM